jgi:hypothetical protein
MGEPPFMETSSESLEWKPMILIDRRYPIKSTEIERLSTAESGLDKRFPWKFARD